MIKDLRKQERIIKIKLKKTGYQFNLDSFVDKLVNDLKIIYGQEKIPNNIKIEIILK